MGWLNSDTTTRALDVGVYRSAVVLGDGPLAAWGQIRGWCLLPGSPGRYRKTNTTRQGERHRPGAGGADLLHCTIRPGLRPGVCCIVPLDQGPGVACSLRAAKGTGPDGVVYRLGGRAIYPHCPH